MKPMKKTCLALALSLVFILISQEASAFTLGVTSDIHAGNKKSRSKSRENVVYPKNYKKNLSPLKKSGVDLILSLGDQTNTGAKKEAKNVAKALKGYSVLWAKGNHDKKAAWKIFKQTNDYVYDKEGWRIIILDSSRINGNSTGGLSATQLTWLEEKLTTDKKVLIAMHHTIWDDNAMTQLYPIYQDFKQIVDNHDNIQYVFNGHTHTRSGCVEKDDVKYCAQRALSLKNHQGSFSTFELD